MRCGKTKNTRFKGQNARQNPSRRDKTRKKPRRFPGAVSIFYSIVIFLFYDADAYRPPSESAGFGAIWNPDIESAAFNAASGV
jgi:hypothetical protein